MMDNGGGACPSQILVWQIQDALVVGVGVHRGHETADGIRRHRMMTLTTGVRTVRGAAGVADDVMTGGVVALVVDTHDEGDVLVLGRAR
jgi:hypothetical protein